MRSIRVELPLAIMLGLAGSTSAFLQNVRPRHLMVPAHKYQAAVSRVARAQPTQYGHRTLRNMRVMSATVDVGVEAADIATSDEAVVSLPDTEAETEVPVIPGSDIVDDPAADEEADEDEANEDDETAEQISLDSIVVGEEYEGVVNNVVSYGAFVDIGTEVNGLVHISQLADEFVANCDDHVKEGDTVRVRVLNVDSETRKLVLSMRSKSRAPITEQGDINKYAKMLEEDPAQFIEATVENIVAYGAFFALEDGSTGFVHISQMSPPGEHVSDVNDIMAIGDKVNVRIREVDIPLGRINLSMIPLDQDTSPQSEPKAMKDKDLSHLVGTDPDEFKTGTVSAVADYGLFVNVEGVDGLLHISKMSLDRSISSSDIHSKYMEGQEVQVRVLEVNTRTGKMSLSMLPVEDDFNFASFLDIPREEWLDGTVVSIMNYGAFVRLQGGVDGMVHISQLHPHGERVDSVAEAVQVGDKVRVRIAEVDMQNRKLRLSMREDLASISQPGVKSGGGGGRQPKRSVTKSVEAFLNIPPEEWIGGTVSSITSFGAFIAVDADTDGLCHISQIADDHVSNVEDFLHVGQDVQVRVIEVDVDNCRLGLSMREPRQKRAGGNGPRGAKRDVSVLVGRDPEQFITGRVVSVVPYGAFVNIEGNIDGLVHISEMAMGRVDNVEDVVQIGQEVQVRIADVNTDNNTVNLSMVPANAFGEGSGRGSGGYGEDRERQGGGGGRGRAKQRNTAASYGKEDFPDAGGQGQGDADGADWQQFLNNYFDDKDE